MTPDPLLMPVSGRDLQRPSGVDPTSGKWSSWIALCLVLWTVIYWRAGCSGRPAAHSERLDFGDWGSSTECQIFFTLLEWL